MTGVQTCALPIYHTYEYADHFKILPAIHNWSLTPERIKNGRKVPAGFIYSSDRNEEWMTAGELGDWILRNARYSEL